MIFLEGKNLCQRQKELNLKVKEAANNNVDFQEIKTAQELSDVDRFFKIDLASKYRNTDYLIEQLKCGDSLYISRALKCDWIYNKEYAHIINPDYLHNKIFPSMSIKMKKKALTTISVHVRDENRAQLFCEYCINKKMNMNAYKFLIFTSEHYKQQFLSKIDLNFFPIENYKDLIGNSLILADIYGTKGGNVAKLSYLYHVNDIEYLDLIEKHHINYRYYDNDPTISGKISRSILKKHKTKILKNPVPYLRVLKRSELLKYSSCDDARVYATALLPDVVSEFWRFNYYKSNKYILELIKAESLFMFIKHIFSNKYPKEEFEMTKNFYDLEYYKFMNVQERESWALMHLHKQTSVLPEDEDYQWYEFVKFAQAFKEIKKKILITTNEDKRSLMLFTLIKSAKTQKEVEELLVYYYKRHVNEKKNLTERFLDNVIDHHKVLEFDEACWDALDKLFHSLDIYFSDSWRTNKFLIHSLIYHIINKRTFPSGLYNYLDKAFVDIDSINWYTEPLGKESQKLVYEYMLQIVTDKIKGFESLDYNEEVSKKVRMYLELLIKLKKIFKQGGDYPEIAIKYMNLDIKNFDYIVDPKPKLEKDKDLKEITPGYLFRCLKQDPTVILEKFSLIQKKNEYPFSPFSEMNTILKKIKVYFSNDVAKKYVDLCLTSLLNISPEKNNDDSNINSDVIRNHVFAIFHLGDERLKAEFMDKHAPASSKIDHGKISRYLLEMQEAICRLHGYSRPPVPLAKTALFLKGDYVHMCKDIFDMYLTNLHPTLRTEFICFLLDSPVSIQKRGLKLTFRAFETSELKEIVLNVWNKTKNVSLRSTIYKLIVEKICENKQVQDGGLFELLIGLTAHIHQNDDESVFNYFNGYSVPEYVRGLHLQTAWKTVSAFPDKKRNIQRKVCIVKAMESCMATMDRDFVEALIDSHISKRLIEQKLSPEVNPDIVKLNEALWDCVANYIVNTVTELGEEKSLNVLRVIVEECYNNWNETHNTEEYVFQLFFKDFASKLDDKASYYEPTFSSATHIFRYLLESFEAKFGIREMYSYYWDWKLSLLARTVIDGRVECDKEIHIRFGTELGAFVKQLKERNCYYNSFLGKILGKISKYTQILINLKKISLTEGYVKILIAYGLALHETLETHVLALEILPQDLTCSETGTELPEVIKLIKKHNNDELTAFLNDKFIYSDLKVRKFLL